MGGRSARDELISHSSSAADRRWRRGTSSID
jgi:hypothetical protein